jgi:hypothetical protein
VWLRRLGYVAVLAAAGIVLFWFVPVLAAILVLGLIGGAFVTAEMQIASRIGRNPYDLEARNRRSGPWEGPR